MPTVLQFRRGTTAQNLNYTGAAGELTVDTTNTSVRAHDGSTPGGMLLVPSAPPTNGSLDIGTSSLKFGNIYGITVNATYADLAEYYTADDLYQPGTVVCFGGEKEITQSTQSHDPAIAGVISTSPAYLMNVDLEDGTPVALQGRVPCRVRGVIRKGDRMVSSDVPGIAERLDNSKYQPGCIIGKALQDHDSDSEGVIEVVVGRV